MVRWESMCLCVCTSWVNSTVYYFNNSWRTALWQRTLTCFLSVTVQVENWSALKKKVIIIWRPEANGLIWFCHFCHGEFLSVFTANVNLCGHRNAMQLPAHAAVNFSSFHISCQSMLLTIVSHSPLLEWAGQFSFAAEKGLARFDVWCLFVLI